MCNHFLYAILLEEVKVNYCNIVFDNLNILLNMKFHGFPLSFLFIILSLALQILSQSFRESASLCQSKETCGECIAAHSRCAWCPDEEETMHANLLTKRCNLFERLDRCLGIISPKNDMIYVANESLSNKGAKNDAVQLQPQHIKIKLRPQSVHTFDVKFRQAKDYPLDLYFLMDLSHSMSDDKENLAKLGSELAGVISKLTNNLRMGFGSFVDKRVMPYVNTLPKMLENPCIGQPDGTCASPYGFRNHMSLSDKLKTFSNSVKNARISGNLDTPEGGFDALMQVIVCKDINWREKSRKVIVLSTDSGFHQAGDGLLGGIIKPNDERCHLDSEGFYVESTTQDYPSISQLNKQIKKTKTNVIFAVTEGVSIIYRELSALLEGSSYGTLDKDSRNVIDLVKEKYEEITSSIELHHNASEKLFVLKFQSSCLEGNNLERNNCTGLKVGDTVTFSVSLTATECPADRSNWKQTIQIHPVGVNEVLLVDIELICECDCQKDGNNEPNSPSCSIGNGTLECGVCNCNKNRYGRHCECSLVESRGNDLDQAPCTGFNDTLICSGRGICDCQVCKCTPRDNPEEDIYGEFCECDNFSCDKYEGRLCNGPERGKCQCGMCQCNMGWKGSACECRDSNVTCIGPDMKLCSDHGECDCGRCKCKDKDGESYRGNYCEECSTCPKHCDLFKDCIQCQIFGTGKFKLGDGQCDVASCPEYNITEVDELESHIEDAMEGGKLCFQADDSDGCRFKFFYFYPKQRMPVVIAQRTKDCPESPKIGAIVSGVAGGTVIIGLVLLLIWKIFAMIHDKREYAKFEEEKRRAQWNKDENPLYKPSIQTIVNPTFDGN